jgi:hypothetical protein
VASLTGTRASQVSTSRAVAVLPAPIIPRSRSAARCPLANANLAAPASWHDRARMPGPAGQRAPDLRSAARRGEPGVSPGGAADLAHLTLLAIHADSMPRALADSCFSHVLSAHTVQRIGQPVTSRPGGPPCPRSPSAQATWWLRREGVIHGHRPPLWAKLAPTTELSRGGRFCPRPVSRASDSLASLSTSSRACCASSWPSRRSAWARL